MDSQTRLKDPQLEGEGYKSRNSLEKDIKALRKSSNFGWSLFLGSFVLNIALGFTVAKTAQPEQKHTYGYIDENGTITLEDGYSSVPTIWQSQKFVEGCVRRAFTFDSSSFNQQLDSTSNCFSPYTFNRFKSNMVNSVVSPLFNNGIRGAASVSELSVKMSDNSDTAPSNSNCSKARIENDERIYDCRVFDVVFDHVARFYELDRNVSRIPRRLKVEVYVLPRSEALNGMYIYSIGG